MSSQPTAMTGGQMQEATGLEKVLSTLENVRGQADSCLVRIERMLVRLEGPAPPKATQDTSEEPNGLMGRLVYATADSFETLQSMQNRLEELERLV